MRALAVAVVTLAAACGGADAPPSPYTYGPPGMGTEWCPIELFVEPELHDAERDPALYGLWYAGPDDRPVTLAVHDQVHEAYVLNEDGTYAYSRPGWYFGFGRWAVRDGRLLLLEEEIVIGHGGGVLDEHILGVVCLMDVQQPPLIHDLPIERCADATGDCRRFRGTEVRHDDREPFIPHAFFTNECNRSAD